MIRFLAVLTLAVCAPAAAGCGASPEPAEPVQGAAASATSAADLAAELTTCRERLVRLEQDNSGVGVMTAAYLALWVVLVGFFFTARQRQRRLILEMRELKARLARLQDDRGPS